MLLSSKIRIKNSAGVDMHIGKLLIYLVAKLKILLQLFLKEKMVK